MSSGRWKNDPTPYELVIQWHTHYLNRGETLTTTAHHFHTTRNRVSQGFRKFSLPFKTERELRPDTAAPLGRVHYVRRRYMAGETLRRIAEDMGLSYATLKNWRERYRWPLQKPISPEERDQMELLAHSGIRAKDIALKTGRSQRTVEKVTQAVRLGLVKNVRGGYWCDCGAYCRTVQHYQAHKAYKHGVTFSRETRRKR